MARLPERIGDYRVLRVLGTGGMGAVYEVADGTGARFAAKVLKAPDDARAAARLEREAELLARLERHPAIVPVIASGKDAEPFMILELVRGETLDALLARGRLEPERAVEIAVALARGLAFVHERGIIHRDLKPSNVLLDEGQGGAPRLTDFGIATAPDLERLTKTGYFVGTISYASPEQVFGRETGPASDVFSLACVLFHMLAGEPPTSSDALEAMMMLTDAEPLRDVRTVNATVAEDLALALAHALVKDPARRTPDARAFERELGARPRGPRRWALVGLAGIAAIVAAVAAWPGPAATEVAPAVTTRLETSYQLALASEGPARARELEAVARLGPPPEALRAAVALAWRDLAVADVRKGLHDAIAKDPEGALERTRARLVLAARARELDPRVDLSELERALAVWRADARENVALRTPIAAKLAPLLADEPNLALVVAWAVPRCPDTSKLRRPLLERACRLELDRDSRRDGGDVALEIFMTFSEEMATPEIDIDLMRGIASRCQGSKGSRSTQDRLEKAETEVMIDALSRQGRHDEAVKLARASLDGGPTRSAEALYRALEAARRWGEIEKPLGGPDTPLMRLIEARARRHQGDMAAALERLGTLKPDDTWRGDDLGPAIDAERDLATRGVR